MSAPEPDAVSVAIGGQLAALRAHVQPANRPGNLDGLFAHHVLRGGAGIEWRVTSGIDEWTGENPHLLGTPAGLAVLGYAVTDDPSAAGPHRTTMAEGLHRLTARNPFPGDRLSFIYDVRVLLGVRLAAEAVREEAPDFPAWLRRMLEDPRLDPVDASQDLLLRHVLADLTDTPVVLGDPSAAEDHELAVRVWMTDSGTAVLAHPAEHAHLLRERAAGALLRADPGELDAPRAALLLHVAETVIGATASRLVPRPSHVGAVLSRFEAALLRWRWDREGVKHPIRWKITAEREVQDILWIMLRPVFDDLVDEETLPKIGHSSYRADFGIPGLGVLIEVKYVRRAGEFKEVEQQVMVDSVAYLKEVDRYRELVVFIYDESASVEHHDRTRRALLELPGVSEVIIVSRPGMLPLPERGTRRGRARSASG
ncbi:PD-(D/E)XK nuclease domain-containing protein [Saccharothrix syringae]|uniref:Uncharacterized protein n=1 Tax=Saccharothrix syringae TaxID=103733 RepID=A0A5Q0GX64_SACSY|nr:hypothetical protein [Saccharothrix syringae]QFZ18521.1 hypothetical protein EKG83_14505 [Saccharothrix syringae]